ncbi:hypothetical protein Cni_G09545 [Canna indica]|uniref:Dilute domain-containing protein n=1 Tax=Canna indica TaxID=4628 RepID=A0AAQ3K2P5_9LILI|nr:hypothetical protein Cni_G09545 [Canna indica]
MTKEIEGARIAIEQAPPITKEVLVEENSMLELLTTRDKELEDELSKLKSKAQEFEERYIKVQKQVEELQKGTEESNSKISETARHDTEVILETNLSVLESENKVLRQQTLLGSTNEDLSERKITTLESDNDLLRNQQKTDCQPIDSSEVIKPPLENELVHDQQAIVHQPSVTSELTEPIAAKENHEALIKCLKEYKSFDNKRHATTLIVYKSLFHWHSFEAERTNIFEQIIQTIRSSVEVENIGELAYWLSTTSTLLFLLQKNLRASNASSTGSYRSRATTSSFFSRIAQNARSSSSIMGISSGYSGMLGKPGSHSRIEARYSALLFKQQLTAYVERLYAIIQDNLKKEINPSLTLCIQGLFARSGTIGESPKSILSNNMAKQASNVHWQSIVKSLDSTLNILCENYVPSMIIRKTFSQVFSFINVQIFNRIGTMFWDDKYGDAKGLSQENDIEDGVTFHQNAIT